MAEKETKKIDDFKGTEENKKAVNDAESKARKNYSDGVKTSSKPAVEKTKDKKVEVGQPYLKDVKINAEVLKQISGEKTISFKYRRRKSSHWTKGHREKLTRIKITDIQAGS